MKYLAAFFTLICALVLFALAYRSYADIALVSARRPGGDFEHYASRSSNGLSFEQAELQSRAVVAGFEGLAGLAFLYATVSFCSGSSRKQPGEVEEKRSERTSLVYEQKPREPGPKPDAPAKSHSDRKSLIRGGRSRIEDLRRSRNKRRQLENR